MMSKFQTKSYTQEAVQEVMNFYEQDYENMSEWKKMLIWDKLITVCINESDLLAIEDAFFIINQLHDLGNSIKVNLLQNIDFF